MQASKGPGDENFPVASWVLGRAFKAPVEAFYAFARAADDVADDPALSPEEKIIRLNAMQARVHAFGDGAPHAFDLLAAFRQDALKTRYDDVDDLMAYCRLSAEPVGRFLIGLTGGDARAWPPSDCLCSALQILNHLQDCGDDYRRLNRVYLPQDRMAREGATDDHLGRERISPELRRVIDSVLDDVDDLLESAADIGRVIEHPRLAREAKGIHALARALSTELRRRDPLASPVKLSKIMAAWTFFRGAFLSSQGQGTAARRSSFYWAMRLMPGPQRDAMFAVYDLCRVADDIADGDLPGAEKKKRLGDMRADVQALFAGEAVSSPVVRGLAQAVRAFDLKPDDFLDLLDGMESDTAQTVRMKTRADLMTYCDRVAVSVGQMAWRIFRAAPKQGPEVAHHLGRALQLTNILRDVKEDARRGRVYVPEDVLAKYGIDASDAMDLVRHDRLGEVLDEVAAWAEADYARAEAAMKVCGRCMRPARIMMAVYRRLLYRLRANNWKWPRPGRPRLPWPEKAWCVARFGVFS